jgi:DegV family protein with EDD domain
VGTALVTDSTAYLEADLRAVHAIEVVPLHVVVGGRGRAEGIDIDATEVAGALRAFTPVSTSRPAPQAFLEAYERLAATGADAIVSVHLSADMSSTVGSAQLAAAQSPVPVTVVDSRTMGMAMGYAVCAGAEAAAGGAPAGDVAALVRARALASSVVFYVDTLEHLRRGGRIGTANALLGSALSIKPILGVSGGHIVPVEKVRTASRAIARLEELAIVAVVGAPADCDGVDIAVHHLDSPDRAEALAERLRGRVPGLRDLRVVELGAVVGAHVGPGTLAVAVCPRVPAPRPGRDDADGPDGPAPDGAEAEPAP